MKYNPFNPNSVVGTNLFAGRTEYIFRVIRKLEQVKRGMPSSFFLFGERGIGKTALVKLIMYVSEIKDPEFGNLNFLTSYYTAEKGQSINSVLESSLNELTDKIPQTVLDTLGQKLGNLLKNGKFTIGAFSVDLSQSEKQKENIVVKDRLVSILSNILESIKLSPERKRTEDGILIVIDEMGNIADLDSSAQLFRGIITTLDVKSLGNICFLLIGYDETLKDFFKEDTSTRRHFDSIKLGVMPMNEAMEVLTKGFREAEVSWNDEDLKKNIIATGGYPHSIQLLGHNLLEIDKDDNIDNEDWSKAINRTAIELQRKDFADLYNFNGKPSGREAILDILAIAGKPLSIQEITKYCKIKNIYQYLPELRKRGSIKTDPETNNITLHSELFRSSIFLKILPQIIEGNYLKDLFEEYFGKFSK